MTSNENSAQEFQKRRRKAFRTAIPCLLAGLICFAAIGLIGIADLPAPAFTISILALLTFLFIGCGILVFRAGYRCPKCGRIPWTDSFTEQGGVDLDPEVCAHCGVRLK
jgi:uncharacterized membrane protein